MSLLCESPQQRVDWPQPSCYLRVLVKEFVSLIKHCAICNFLCKWILCVFPEGYSLFSQWHIWFEFFNLFLKVWVLRFLYIMNAIYQIFYNSLAIELTFFWLLESRIEVGVLIWMMSSLPWLGLFKFYSWIFSCFCLLEILWFFIYVVRRKLNTDSIFHQKVYFFKMWLSNSFNIC